MKKGASKISVEALEWQDAAARHCRALETLAGLLAHSNAEELSPQIISETGALIAGEAQRLRKLVQSHPGQKETR